MSLLKKAFSVRKQDHGQQRHSANFGRRDSKDPSAPFVYHVYFDPRPVKRAVLLIDPQNDFVAEWGSLAVPGAIKDSDLMAQQIVEHSKSISQIFTTMDTHQRMHIAHPLFWLDKAGGHPKPFAEITFAQVEAGEWKTSVPEFQTWARTYVAEIEKQGRFKLTIWPEHCLVGSKGHAVYDTLSDALHVWEEQNKASVNFIFKGNNALTEHYSAFKAEVPKPDDPHTSMNLPFLRLLDSYDEILVAGQALSHCVNFSVRDMASALANPGKIKVLTDCSSAIVGFEKEALAFRTDMEKVGVQFLTAQEAFKSPA